MEPVRLNLGCGHDVRPGWVNIDLHAAHRPDIVCDVLDLKPLADQSADFALAQDILEHIPRSRAMTALREWNRVLRIGGEIEIRVPDVIAIVDLMRGLHHDYNHVAGHYMLMQSLFGTQGYEGDFHYNAFTELTLRDSLDKAGFAVKHLGHHHDWLFLVVATKVRHEQPDALLRIASDDDFVRAAYASELGREADEGGLAHFTGLIRQGIARETVLEVLRASPEAAQRRGA